MSGRTRSIVLVLAVFLLVGGVAVCKTLRRTPSADAVTSPPSSRPTSVRLPRLVDLGAGKCVPCRMMAPILEELRKEYDGRFDVVFVDVIQDPKTAKMYDYSLIPTQIFFDADGKERYRHEGFISKADILGTWKKLGVEIQ